MSLEGEIKRSISKGFKELYNVEVESGDLKLEATSEKFDGDLSFVVFPFLRLSRKKPEETAEDLGNYLIQHIDEIESFNVIKGFLNFVISNSYWPISPIR